MNRWLVSLLVLGVVAPVVGCSSASRNAPSASPVTSAQAECERSGGVWRAALNFCEYPAPGSPTPVR